MRGVEVDAWMIEGLRIGRGCSREESALGIHEELSGSSVSSGCLSSSFHKENETRYKLRYAPLLRAGLADDAPVLRNPRLHEVCFSERVNGTDLCARGAERSNAEASKWTSRWKVSWIAKRSSEDESGKKGRRGSSLSWTKTGGETSLRHGRSAAQQRDN
ncbi:hypothetical protein KM043_006594 [Ampulex compressa]|nr:hypothetical protein KM043_006594 [Ampulex compressa]